jgi:hypothetical protein
LTYPPKFSSLTDGSAIEYGKASIHLNEQKPESENPAESSEITILGQWLSITFSISSQKAIKLDGNQRQLAGLSDLLARMADRTSKLERLVDTKIANVDMNVAPSANGRLLD